jgi:uncharacterized protein (DUF1810 family)
MLLMGKDPFNLQRFVDAQERVYAQVLAELRAGRKATHWIWFIFPQIRGLGRSPTAWSFGIASREEAVAYLDHPVLGPRLQECTQLVNKTQGRSAEDIFGSLDALKFRSCMTLFSNVTSDNKIFKDALQKYFASQRDELTLEKL